MTQSFAGRKTLMQEQYDIWTLFLCDKAVKYFVVSRHSDPVGRPKFGAWTGQNKPQGAQRTRYLGSIFRSLTQAPHHVPGTPKGGFLVLSTGLLGSWIFTWLPLTTHHPMQSSRPPHRSVGYRIPVEMGDRPLFVPRLHSLCFSAGATYSHLPHPSWGGGVYV